MPALAMPSPKRTAKMPAAKVIALPGVDPTRTVRMKPVSVTAALPPSPVAVPPVRPASPIPLEKGGMVQLTMPTLIAIVILVAGVAAAVAIVMTRVM